MNAPADDWQYFRTQNDADLRIMADVLGLSFPPRRDSDDVAAWLMLFDLGVTAGRVVPEPTFKVNPSKAERDAALERPTMHLAPLWRHPLTDEDGYAALILPVRVAPADLHRVETMAFGACHDEPDTAEDIGDLIAIPIIDGKPTRPLSQTGYTSAVGFFEADEQGRLVLYANGKAWIAEHLAQARAAAAEWPPHLVEDHCMPFQRIRSALVIEPMAITWRLQRWGCVVPPEARAVCCPDSHALAEFVTAEMPKRDKVRTPPPVYGPPETKKAAA